jgi:hypothetical protein
MLAHDPSRSSNHAFAAWILPILVELADGSNSSEWMRARMLSSLAGQLLEAHLQGRAASFEEEATLRDLKHLLHLVRDNEDQYRQLQREDPAARYGPVPNQDWPLVQAELKRLIPLVDPIF